MIDPAKQNDLNGYKGDEMSAGTEEFNHIYLANCNPCGLSSKDMTYDENSVSKQRSAMSNLGWCVLVKRLEFDLG